MTVVAEHATVTDARTHYVYRLYDAADRLLYVGMTNDTGQRLRDHKRTKPWWGEVYRQEIQAASTRADAFFIEAAAILRERPAYNLDIPSLDRYDVLKSRSTVADPMTTGDRIAALEHQLREARRENARNAADSRAAAELLAAENASLRASAVTAAAERRSAQESLLATVGIWRDLAEKSAAALKAKEQVRLFVVEGPRTVVQEAGTQLVTAPPARRSFLRRLTGG